MRAAIRRLPSAPFAAFAVLALALSACSDISAPLAPDMETGGPSLLVAPTSPTTYVSGTDSNGDGRDDEVWVCPEATAFSTSLEGCHRAYLVPKNPRWNIIPNTQWISNEEDGSQFFAEPQQYYYYKILIDVPAGATDIRVDTDMYADNAATVFVNGVFADEQPQFDHYPNYGCTFMTPDTNCNGGLGLTGPPTRLEAEANFVAGATNVVTFRNLNAEFVQGCENVHPSPTCDSATGLNFGITVAFTPPLQGCSPGFFKNHQWVDSEYSRSQILNTVFNIPNAGGTNLGTSTLEQALDFGGGPQVLGAQRILLRQAVAALLNAENVSHYPLTEAQVISQVNAALASNNRQTILNLAGTLDTYNNLGCDLNWPNVNR